MVGAATVSGSNGSCMIVLKLKRPILFQYKPGQYVFLQISSIDNQWHPFSIASGPDSSDLEFYIEVCGEKSWTAKLWNVLVKSSEGDKESASSFRLIVDVMGPYGTSLAKTEDFSHALALGAGTGRALRFP
jgi:NAD(P)H-flavin reductase